MPNFDSVTIPLKSTTNSVVTINESSPSMMILYPERH